MAVYKNTGIFETRLIEGIDDLSHLEIGAIGNIRASIAEHVRRAIAVLRPDVQNIALERMSFDEIRHLVRSTLTRFADSRFRFVSDEARKLPAFEDAWNLLIGAEVAEDLWRFQNEALYWIKARDLEANELLLLRARWKRKVKDAPKRSKQSRVRSRTSTKKRAIQVEKHLAMLRQNNRELFEAANLYEGRQRTIRAIGRHNRGDVFTYFPVRPKTAICPSCRAEALADAGHCEQQRTSMIAKLFELGMKLQVRRFEPDVKEIENIREKRRIASANSLKAKTVDNRDWTIVRDEIDAVLQLPGRGHRSDSKIAAEVACNLEAKGRHDLSKIDTIRKKISKVRRFPSTTRQSPQPEKVARQVVMP